MFGNDACNMNINIIYVFEPMSQCFITEGNQNSASYDLALRHYYCILRIKNVAPLIKMYLRVPHTICYLLVKKIHV